MNTRDSYKFPPVPQTPRAAAVAVQRGVRPRRILVSYTDPFDDLEIASSDMAYQPRWAARGIYTKQIRRVQQALKSIQSHILEGREPNVNVRLVA